MQVCKLCGNTNSKRFINQMCLRCYTYFYIHKFREFKKSSFGSLSFVSDKTDKQYGYPICHICGRAYIKLQQHIYNTHGMSKNEYCDAFGLDHSIRMTAETYHQKMRNYAYENKMDEQLKQAGYDTRFKANHKFKYNRSQQTLNRLATQFKDQWGNK